jgi:hypothetical protein
MRRFFLTLTVISFAGWSQPPQQPAQPPIPVKIEMPSESIWTVLFKLAIPTILGAVLGSDITLYGLRQTNKHNAAENKANREHQLQVEIAKAEIAAKYKSQDNMWEFRKDVYVNLIQALSMAGETMKQVGLKLQESYQLRHTTPVDSNKLDKANTNINLCLDQLRATDRQIDLYAPLAPLAMADDVLPLISALELAIAKADTINIEIPENLPVWTNLWTKRYAELLQKLQAAGRKDLWGTSEHEAKAESAKQT